MESISIGNMPQKTPTILLILVLGLCSFAAFGQEQDMPVYQMRRQSAELPDSPHLVHWLQNRLFSLSMNRSAGAFSEKNNGRTADFADEDTKVTAVFDRQVNPSVGLGFSLAHVKSDSSYQSEDAGLSSDVERQVRSSVVAADGTFKIMDALIVGLRLGFQTSQLTFNETDRTDNKFSIVGPALSWKGSAFELTAVQTVKIGKNGSKQNRHYIESALILSSLTRSPKSDWDWQLWVQKNPLPVCCAFAHTDRMVYGGKLYIPMSSWTVSPGYRYLSEFQVVQQPGTIEDVARHHLFIDGATAWDEWMPSLNVGYEWAARKDGPSSFKIDQRSDITAYRWIIAGSWGRVW